MKRVVFALSDHEAPTAAIANASAAQIGQLAMRSFPDRESHVRLVTPVADCDVIFVASLDNPDIKTLPLLFAAAAARDLGALRVGLVAPYLAYMRQDTRFEAGEAVTSVTYAHLLSSHFDWLVTVDPHLHRHHDLSGIYSIPSRVVPAAPAIARWITNNVRSPLLIGPDRESAQWVGNIAGLADAPCEIFDKERHGDRDVAVSARPVDRWRDRIPVLVDDIIASGRTMAMAIHALRDSGLAAPVCIGVHAIFAGDAQAFLQAAGPARIVTCDTIVHATNAIQLGPALGEAVRQQLAATDL